MYIEYLYAWCTFPILSAIFNRISMNILRRLSTAHGIYVGPLASRSTVTSRMTTRLLRMAVIHKIQCLLFCRLIDPYIHFATMTIYSENLGLSCGVKGKCSHDVIKRQWRWLALTYWPNYQLSVIDHHKEICWQWIRYAHDLSQ